jgi:hypothetical protein
MKSVYKIIFGLSALSILVFTGCKKFRDVNTNPNSPEQVTINLLLPAAQGAIAQQLGGKFQIAGGIWSQYWTQDPSASQYRVFEQYQIDGSDINKAWNGLYSGALTDLDQIIRRAGTQKNYIAIAKILKGYTFQILTDQFGDIPFTEALKGESDNITSPHYDRQEIVYNGLISLIKEGMSEIDVAGSHPGQDDLIYGGDMDAWKKFGNTLLLRAYMRLSSITPTAAQQGIAELYANGIGFIAAGETAKIVYSAEPGNYNPLYSEINNSVLARQLNLIASATAIDSFLANNDPRITAFYYANGTFKGLRQGNYSSGSGTYSTPSAAVGGDVRGSSEVIAQAAVAPVIFLSDYESLFLQAEAAVRGWGTGNDKALFESAVTANFNAYGAPITNGIGTVFPAIIADSLATSDTTGYPVEIRYDVAYAAHTYLKGDAGILNGNYYLGGVHVSATPASHWGAYPSTGTAQEKIQYIITQKWFSMCGNQSIEAWTEWRRTGFPDFFVVSVNSRIGNNFPVRFPYPDDETSNNLNFPGQKLVTDKVWWDAN